ncbi:MAG: bifunctional DNA-binding transcriptional regulator/O6-methylguanine-DNA methyltransferase Ada [Gemmatimonadaceae bacterium]
MNETKAWEAVLRRDASADDLFFYGVATTGVYCRPSCASRRPLRDNVAFFSTAEAAERAGFRACRRCGPANNGSSNRSIENLREYIDTSLASASGARITLEVLGRKSGMSPYHLQRKFKKLIGLTPAEYVRAQKTARLKGELKRGESVSRATFGAGYGSSSRVYGDAAATLGMTPAMYRRGGAGAEIQYVIASTSLGALLVAATTVGICAVTLGANSKTLEGALAQEYPAATRRAVDRAASPLGKWVDEIVAAVEGESTTLTMPLDVRASTFQRRVWRELRKIPFGETRTYTEIAESIGSPQAARAVATACASNRVAIVIPCHRVVRRDGELGGYRWGVQRKERLIATERAERDRRTS